MADDARGVFRISLEGLETIFKQALYRIAALERAIRMTLQGFAKVAVKGLEERQVVGSVEGWHFFLAMVLIIILAMVPMCGKRKPRRSGGKGNPHSALL